MTKFSLFLKYRYTLCFFYHIFRKFLKKVQISNFAVSEKTNCIRNLIINKFQNDQMKSTSKISLFILTETCTFLI